MPVLHLSSVHQYLQFCSTSCTDPSAVSFYQKFKVRQRDQDSAHQLDHLTTGSAPSGGPFPAPALPPKKKQQVRKKQNSRLLFGFCVPGQTRTSWF